MTLPTNKENNESCEINHEITDSLSDTENRFADVLKNVVGAGDVKVILTISEGETTYYQTNDSIDERDTQNNIDKKTVTVSDSNRNETGLIKQIVPAIYKGAVVVCQGADDPAIRLALVDAISKLTGLGADKISVLKMK